MAIPIPDDIRQLLDAPNYVHLATLRTDGSPRVVWVGREGDHILVCTSNAIWKAKDMRRDPRVAMSVPAASGGAVGPRYRELELDEQPTGRVAAGGAGTVARMRALEIGRPSRVERAIAAAQQIHPGLWHWIQLRR